MFLNIFGCFWAFLDVLGHLGTLFEVFRVFWNISGRFLMFLDVSDAFGHIGMFWDIY